jgi:hypothetical protein
MMNVLERLTRLHETVIANAYFDRVESVPQRQEYEANEI